MCRRFVVAPAGVPHHILARPSCRPLHPIPTILPSVLLVAQLVVHESLLIAVHPPMRGFLHLSKCDDLPRVLPFALVSLCL